MSSTEKRARSVDSRMSASSKERVFRRVGEWWIGSVTEEWRWYVVVVVAGGEEVGSGIDKHQSHPLDRSTCLPIFAAHKDPFLECLVESQSNKEGD